MPSARIARTRRFAHTDSQDRGTNRMRPVETQQPPAPRAGSIARRLVYALTLIPIVPATSCMGMNLCDTYGSLSPSDGLRVLHLFFALLWVMGTIIIWRALVVWTLGRAWLTTLVGMIPFVQVVYGQPLWIGTGCSRFLFDEGLRHGQLEVGISLFVWMSIWLWWVWEKRQMVKRETKSRTGASCMSPVAIRLAASIGSLPFVFGVFLISGVALEDFAGLSDPLSENLAVTAVVAVSVWLVIWRRSVIWSGPVLRRTMAATILCLALPIAMHFLLAGSGTDVWDMILGCLPVIGWGVWMAVTVYIWPQQAWSGVPGEMGPHCPSCGYLLKGLRATRCPECGTEPTLDELWAAETGVLT